jgi:hypothetical protein
MLSLNKSGRGKEQSHMTELDKKLARHKAMPGELLSLDELQKRIKLMYFLFSKEGQSTGKSKEPYF